MSRASASDMSWLGWLAAGGAVLTGAVVLAVRSTASTPKGSAPTPPAPPAPARPLLAPLNPLDVEAVARMLASENPSGSLRLHVEQVHTQIRAAQRAGQSLFERITAGSGWGEQGRRAGNGKKRPVATHQPATEALRERARQILRGEYESVLAGALKFFEPDQQDKAFVIAERARQKRAKGQPLTDQEQRLLHYEKDARTVRASWLAEGARLVGSLEGVEFYS